MAKKYFNLSDLVFVEKSTFPTFQDLTGQSFGQLNVLGYAGKGKGYRHLWFCQCTCGNITKVAGNDLRSGHSQSCGCLSRNRPSPRRTHGLTETVEYCVYTWMKSRCENPNNKSFSMYGGRGIKVLLSFEEFLQEVGERPSKEHSIDRINSNGHYEKGNLRWALPKEQSRNTRRNCFVSLNGNIMTVAEAASKTGLNDKVIYGRLKKGYCKVHALSLTLRPERPKECPDCQKLNTLSRPLS